MKWMSSCELLCLTVKLQSSKQIYYFLDFLISKIFVVLNWREGVKIIS